MITEHAAVRKCLILCATSGILIIPPTAAINMFMELTGMRMKDTMDFIIILVFPSLCDLFQVFQCRLVLRYVLNSDQAHWIGNYDDPLATTTYGKRYIFADLIYKELSAQIRVDWTLTPTLSFQLFAQPFISSGNFTNFKEFMRPRSFDFLAFGKDGSTITKNFNSDGSIESYDLDPDGSGPAQPINISNPNFNFVSLRGNAVLRWEYMPGSTLYLVWTQSRSDNITDGTFNMSSSFDRLGSAKPDNIFMLKLTYWIGEWVNIFCKFFINSYILLKPVLLLKHSISANRRSCCIYHP